MVVLNSYLTYEAVPAQKIKIKTIKSKKKTEGNFK